MDISSPSKQQNINILENNFHINNGLNGTNTYQNSLKQYQSENTNKESIEEIKNLQQQIGSQQAQINTQNHEKNELQQIIFTLEQELHKYRESSDYINNMTPQERYNSPSKYSSPTKYSSPLKSQQQDQETEYLRLELQKLQKQNLEINQQLSIKTQELVIYQQLIEDNSSKMNEVQFQNQLLSSNSKQQRSPSKNESFIENSMSPDKEEIEMVKRQYEIINQERHQLEDLMVQLQSSNKILMKDNEELIEKSRKQEKELAELKQITLVQMESELESTKNKLKNLSQNNNSKQYLERIEQLAFDKQNLQRKIDELYENLEELQNSQQEQYYNQKQQFMQENSQLQTQLREIQLTNDKEKATYEHSLKQLDHKEKRIQAIEKELESLRNSYKNADQSRETLEKQNLLLQKQMNQLVEDLQSKEKFEENLNQQIQHLTKSLQKFEKQNLTTDDSIKQEIQKQQDQDLNQIVEQQNDQINDLQDQLEQYKNEIHLRSMKYDEIQGILDHISEAFKDQLNEKERHINEKQRQINELLEKQKNFEAQNNSFQQSLFDKKDANTKRCELNKDGIIDLEQQITSRNEQIKILQDQIQKQEEEKYLKADLISVQSRQIESKYQQILKQKDEELEQVLCDIQQLQQEKKNISNFIEQKCQTKYQQLEQEFQQQLQQLSSDKSVLLNKQQEYQQQITKLYEQLQNRSRNQEDHDISIVEARLQEQYEENQNLIQEFNLEQKKHNTEINKLNQDLFTKNNEIKSLEQQLKKNQANEQLEEFNIINKKLQEELLFINKKYKEQYQENQQLQFSVTQAQSEIKILKDKDLLQSNQQQKINQLIQELNKQETIIEKMQQEKKNLLNDQFQNQKDSQFLENFKQEIKNKDKQNQKEKEELLQQLKNKELELKRTQQSLEIINSTKKNQEDQQQDLKNEQKYIQKYKQLSLDQNKDIVNKLNQEDSQKKLVQSPEKDPLQSYQNTSPVKVQQQIPQNKQYSNSKNTEENSRLYTQTRENDALKTDLNVEGTYQYDNNSAYYQNQALEQMYSKCIQRSKNLLNKNEVLLNTLKQTHMNNQFLKLSPEKIQEKFTQNKYEQTANQYQNYLNIKDKNSDYELEHERFSVSSVSQAQQTIELDRSENTQNSVSSQKQRSFSQNIAAFQIEAIKDPIQQMISLKNNHQTPLRYMPAKQQEQLKYKAVSNMKPKYEGEKVGQQRQGRGRMWYCNGEVYEGEWKSDKRSGYGILKDSTGEIYNGDWINDLYNGQGRLRNKNIEPLNTEFEFRNFDKLCNFWVSFSGEFKNNTPHGLGTLILSNGEKFLGSFSGGKVHGEGTFYRLNGEIQVGFWQNNKFVGNL